MVRTQCWEKEENGAPASKSSARHSHTQSAFVCSPLAVQKSAPSPHCRMPSRYDFENELTKETEKNRIARWFVVVAVAKRLRRRTLRAALFVLFRFFLFPVFPRLCSIRMPSPRVSWWRGAEARMWRVAERAAKQKEGKKNGFFSNPLAAGE